MASSSDNTTIIGTLPDDELRTARVLHEILKHLTVNILTELPTEGLYSPQLSHTLEENKLQLETRLGLVSDICSILEILATVPTINSLHITWLNRNQQCILYKAILQDIVNTTYVNGFLLATWENILEARLGQMDIDYEIPPIRVIVGQEAFPDEINAGHHHLGILYPFNRDFVLNEISPEPKRNRKLRARQRKLQATAPLRRYSRIYPQIISPDQEEDISWKIFPEIIFPDLCEVLFQLAYNLVTNDYPQLKHIPYRRIIQALDGPSGVTKRLLGGYLDYITDDEDPRYWRPYVGQSATPEQRIKEHSLHYFIVWKGKGRRAMNFIRLWTLDDIEFLDEESAIIFPNLLEMSLAMAFETLPLHTNTTYSGIGISLKSHVRQAYTLQIRDSCDPHIQMWPSFREETRVPDTTVGKWCKGQALTTWSEYVDLFCSAVRYTGTILGDDVFDAPISLNESMHHLLAQEQLSAAIHCLTGEEVCHEYPVGNLASKIGIILSTCMVRVDVNKNDVHVPWGIRESGFNDDTCLLWFADPRERSYTRQSQAHDTSLKVTKALVTFNSNIIQQSGLRVIILDRTGASKYVIPGLPEDSGHFEMTMYCGNITGHLEKEGGRLKRVYLVCPSSLVSLWANPGPTIQRIGEVFKLAAALTNTHGIRPYFCNSSAAVHHILRIYAEENNGAEKMTVSTLTPILQAFLFRKGFHTAEGISRLEEIGGSLSRGLMLLLFTLRRRPGTFDNGNRRPLRQPSAPEYRKNIFSRDELQRMDSLYASAQVHPPFPQAGDTSGDYQLHDIALESLGQVDNKEVNEVEQLAGEREEAMKATWTPQEEYLNTEFHDIDLNSACNELFPATEDDAESQGDLGILQIRAPVSQQPGWKHGRDKSILNGREYKGAWSSCDGMQIHAGPDIAAIVLRLGKGPRHSFPAVILVKAEVYPGKRHPNNWACDALDIDPGAKLAFLVTHRKTEYLQAEGEGNARKANTFMDWLSNCSIETIAIRPRRHINAHQTQIIRPLNLPGKGTWFTDDQGKLVKSTEEGPQKARYL
ncbi:hypothetical protein BDW59DRAFT_178181 [Aspergillus cavernicola]|uniref:Heterokaryon incompatibility domain-containing protein n=1 Tax=Aspergillus cavernicola TaxID=176166 RepID=A0ABR4IT27_9EURO